MVQQHRENERASVVIGGISLSVIRDREDGVLQNSRVISQPVQMVQFNFRQVIQRLLSRASGELDLRTFHAVAPDSCKTCHITLRYPLPDHFPREQISAFTHSVAVSRGIQKFDRLLCDDIPDSGMAQARRDGRLTTQLRANMVLR